MKDKAITKSELNIIIEVTKPLINVIESRNQWTRGHSERVAHYATQIAQEMNFNDAKVKKLLLSGILHDIGYISTGASLLGKASLSYEEFNIIKKHPDEGAKILERIRKLKDIAFIVRHHHERIDGNGYPDGLKGDEIPIEARILHVTDSFDSMTLDKPHRRSSGIEYAIAELKKYSGLQFDTQVVDAFLKISTLEDSLYV
ncbi:MAG: HD domain-containing protein [Thermodesulfovibrionia bacterium]|nr:HD domain-containing protein [Thermodesulfovibrionia bacterium]MCK5426970.1 HD domain-containing protein [Thermodesulfovibrionia bacterium]